MNRRDALKAGLGLVVGASLPVAPQEPEKAPWLFVDRVNGAMVVAYSIIYVDTDGKHRIIEYVGVCDAIPNGALNGWQCWKPGPRRFERKDVVEAREKAVAEAYRNGVYSVNEIKRLEQC